MKTGDSIEYKNPFQEIDKIKICNSFQLKPKTMKQTIRTLMGNQVKNVKNSEDIQVAIAAKLSG